MQATPLSVVVLHEAFGADARSDERDALVQLREVSEALQRLGVEVVIQPIDLDLKNALRRLRRHHPSCVFNLVESLARKGELIGMAPALLKIAAIPFTGSGSEAVNLSSQKILAKRWMALHGIATPEWFTTEGHLTNDRRRRHSFAPLEPALRASVETLSNSPAMRAPTASEPIFERHAFITDEALDDDRQSWIVKSLWEHASFGLDDSSVVRGKVAAGQRIKERARELGGHWFAERYIDGREFNISMLEHDGEPQVLPIAEMSFVDYPATKPRIVGYAAKWDETASEYHATRRSYPELQKGDRDALHSIARECWRLFELRGYARVDIRMDEQGAPWVLEVNANPCLSTDAGFVAAAAEAGIAYDRIIERILEAALRTAMPAAGRLTNC